MKHPDLLAATLIVALAASSCSNSGSNPASPELPTDGAPVVAPAGIELVSSPVTGGDMLRFSPSPSPGVTGYELYQYSPSPVRDNSYELKVTLRSGITEYELPAGTDHALEYWRVVALTENGGRSPQSATATVRRRAEGSNGPRERERDPSGVDGWDN